VRRLGSFAALLAIGAAWGLTLPLIRVAVSTGHQPLGLILWQKVIMLVVLAALLAAMRKPPPPVRGNLGLFAVVAVFGAVLPGYFTFLTAADLPAGVRAIVVALVPMFVLPLALALGFERPDLRRAAGVLLGALSVALIVLPGAGVTAGAGTGAVLLALLSPLSYAVEAIYLGWRGPHGLHPFQLLLGASVVGIALAWPLAAATGELVSLGAWGTAEWALLGAGVLNALAYSGYVWLVARSGSLFASQIAYLVTGIGVVWSMVLLGETYAPLVWGAFVLMLAAIALVQPLAARAKKA
jgi:drug/metabolite transporter (DMT)-like permease